ncbi:Proteophosphoglycan ppg4 [Rhodotorula diobovata]|uniref:Proteophosphoglycan ppg4 n=1 Tax=Rhodotorula diobovata TaxID=5288 RepID=A0A5C5G708_9BASI|nr:Proteophosphoglycan ppg4 [Rhodotorula diobovata]
MPRIRLPGSAGPSSPLLPHDSDVYDLPRPRRRCSRAVLALASLAALATVLLAHRTPVPAALEQYRERIPDLRLWRAQAQAGAALLEEPEVEAALAVLNVVEDESEPVVEAEVEEPLPAVAWSKEDRHLRRYSWATPKVHSSLGRMLQSLTPAQNTTREWLLKSRTLTTGGTGVGLGADDPPKRIKPSPPLPAHSFSPAEGEGPGLFVDGSYDKYDDLLHEWRTGRPVEACEKGEWEDEYTQMHAEMLSGEREASLLEFVCHAGEYCGGFADRILGMTTTFLYSILTKRAFSVAWEQPAPVDLFFDSPHIDWSRPFNQSSTTPVSPVYANKTLVKKRREVNAHNWEPEHVDQWMPRFVRNYGENKKSPWIQLDFNRGVIIRSWTYKQIAPLLDNLGLKAMTAYSCLINYLLRPKPAALAFIAQYTSFFSLPENFVIGIQIRTGDLSMWADYKDAVNSVALHPQYFTCAEAVARTYAHPSQRIVYYLITDSHALERDALRRFGDRVVVTGLKQAHVEIKTDTSTGLVSIKRAADGFMRTIAESWIFAGTDFQILTSRSGFGKIPTWLRGRQGSTIALFNEFTDPEYTVQYKAANEGRLPPPVDCSSPDALTSFEAMASEWSLG